jgi:predicted RNA-binding protein (virulence factor B family)
MPEIGKINQLSIVRESESGLYLDGENLGEILLPTRLVPRGILPSHKISVFIHFDSEDRIIATTERPEILLGEMELLQVLDVSKDIGAFLDWGLSKDLLLPFREQTRRVTKGQKVLVILVQDKKSKRLIASTRLSHFSKQDDAHYEVNEQVKLIVINQTDLGYNAVVNGVHIGLLYHTELSRPLRYGERLTGYVAKMRENGKIDLRLDRSGPGRKMISADIVFQKLKAKGGSLPYNDKTDPELIRQEFDLSKKAFKQGISSLYKDRKILITKDGISIV